MSDDTGRIAMYEYWTVGWDNSPQELMRYIYSNNLSSSMLELDDTGNIISYEEYHPFGTTAYQATNASINAVAKRYRYTGKERDEESGLYYHGARYYIPWLCRWTQCDPIGIKDGLNVYAYCSNNPVMLHDPSGKSGEPEPTLEDRKKTIETLYAKSVDESLSIEDRNAAKVQMVAEIDTLINKVNENKETSVSVELNSDIFYTFLVEKKLISDTQETKSNYESGCIGITMVLTGKTADQLRNNAIFKNYEEASIEELIQIYSIHFHDAELFYQNPEVKEYIDSKMKEINQNPEVMKEAYRKANSDSVEVRNSFTEQELELYFVSEAWKQITASGDDYKEKEDGTVDISGWDYKSSVGMNMDFGYYFKENVIFHATQVNNPKGSMRAIISNKLDFEKEINNDSNKKYKNLIPFGCLPSNPCIGYLNFNRKVYGGF